MGYSERWFPIEDSDAAVERIIDVIERNEALSVAFEGWLAERQVTEKATTERSKSG